MTTIRTTWSGKRPVLGLDIETRRKGSDWGEGRYKRRDFFCGAMGYADSPARSFSEFDPEPDVFREWMAPLLSGNLLVVGHNVWYDLSGIHQWAIHLRLPGLSPVLVSDTWKHWLGRGPMNSGRLGAMAHRYGIPAKGHVEDFIWDAAYAGDPEAREAIRIYNMQDVDVALALRARLLELGMLRQARVWRP